MSSPARRPRNGELNHPTAGGKPTAEATPRRATRPKCRKAPAPAGRRTEASADYSENARRPGIRVRAETADSIRGNQRGHADDRGRAGVQERDLAGCYWNRFANTSPARTNQSPKQRRNPRQTRPPPMPSSTEKRLIRPITRRRRNHRNWNIPRSQCRAPHAQRP